MISKIFILKSKTKISHSKKETIVVFFYVVIASIKNDNWMGWVLRYSYIAQDWDVIYL